MPSEPSPKDDNKNEQLPERSVEADDTDSTEQPSSVPEILDNLSDSQREGVTRFFGSGMEMSVVSGNPFASKITESHMTDMISLASKELDYDYSDRQRTRIFWGLFGGFVLTLLIAFAVFLAVQDMSDLLTDLVKGGVIFLSGVVGGLGGGYGLARARRNR